ncbi:hypothetical protein [Burkholderia anthina]|uniref:hypothetical protein n=1 Tax=Burkholderia anthina TaxID=179879 RepID=UPI001589DF46
MQSIDALPNARSGAALRDRRETTNASRHSIRIGFAASFDDVRVSTIPAVYSRTLTPAFHTFCIGNIEKVRLFGSDR